MHSLPLQSTANRLPDFIVGALGCLALAVSVAGLTRAAPEVAPVSTVTEPTKPALVKLDPTKLKTAAPANRSVAEPSPNLALAPAPLAPLSSLPDLRLPNLPTVPAVVQRKSPATPTTNRGVEQNSTPGPVILDSAELAGRQPWPEYPYECLRRRESGVVRVEFEVAENGTVRRARAVASSGCARLDEAATETILRRWEFPAGAVRLFEISIHFQLQ